MEVVNDEIRTLSPEAAEHYHAILLEHAAQKVSLLWLGSFSTSLHVAFDMDKALAQADTPEVLASALTAHLRVANQEAIHPASGDSATQFVNAVGEIAGAWHEGSDDVGIALSGVAYAWESRVVRQLAQSLQRDPAPIRAWFHGICTDVSASKNQADPSNHGGSHEAIAALFRRDPVPPPFSSSFSFLSFN